MRTGVKAILFLSSVSPMFLILFVQNFNFAILHKTSSANKSLFLIEPIIAWIFLGLVILPNIVLFLILGKSKGNTPSNCTINEINTKSSDVLNYMATYVIPLLAFK